MQKHKQYNEQYNLVKYKEKLILIVYQLSLEIWFEWLNWRDSAQTVR